MQEYLQFNNQSKYHLFTNKFIYHCNFFLSKSILRLSPVHFNISQLRRQHRRPSVNHFYKASAARPRLDSSSHSWSHPWISSRSAIASLRRLRITVPTPLLWQYPSASPSTVLQEPVGERKSLGLARNSYLSRWLCCRRKRRCGTRPLGWMCMLVRFGRRRKSMSRRRRGCGIGFSIWSGS